MNNSVPSGFKSESFRQTSKRLNYLGQFQARGHNVSVALILRNPHGGLKTLHLEGFKYPNQILKEHPETVSIAYLSPWKTLLERVDVSQNQIGYNQNILSEIEKGNVDVKLIAERDNNSWKHKVLSVFSSKI